MAQIIKTDGYVIDIEPKNGTDFKLDELKTFVSGYVEIVQLDHNRIMVVNEEGKLMGLGINHVATQIFCRCHPRTQDIIVGDVLICRQDQVK